MTQSEDRYLPEILTLNAPGLDDTHEEIFELLASLKARCLESEFMPSEAIEILLTRLQEHFDTEERLADGTAADFSAHSQKHQELLRFITQALSKGQPARSNVVGLLRYIEYWCERHIADEDKRLVAGLHGEPPIPAGD